MGDAYLDEGLKSKRRIIKQPPRVGKQLFDGKKLPSTPVNN